MKTFDSMMEGLQQMLSKRRFARLPVAIIISWVLMFLLLFVTLKPAEAASLSRSDRCGFENKRIYAFQWDITVMNKGLADVSQPPAQVVTTISTGNGTSILGTYSAQVPKGSSTKLPKYERNAGNLPAGLVTVTTTVNYSGQEIMKQNNTCTHQFTLK